MSTKPVIRSDLFGRTVEALSVPLAAEAEEDLLSAPAGGGCLSARGREHEVHQIVIGALLEKLGLAVLQGDRERCLSAGMDACVTKPVLWCGWRRN